RTSWRSPRPRRASSRPRPAGSARRSRAGSPSLDTRGCSHGLRVGFEWGEAPKNSPGGARTAPLPVRTSGSLQQPAERGPCLAVGPPLARALGGLQRVVEPCDALAEGVAVEPRLSAALAQGLAERARRRAAAPPARTH